MLIVACQKCGEVKVLAGSPGPDGVARAVWTCGKCGAGQVMELAISKDARKGDLRKIIGGLALAGQIAEESGSEPEESAMQDIGEIDGVKDGPGETKL